MSKLVHAPLSAKTSGKNNIYPCRFIKLSYEVNYHQTLRSLTIHELRIYTKFTSGEIAKKVGLIRQKISRQVDRELKKGLIAPTGERFRRGKHYYPVFRPLYTSKWNPINGSVLWDEQGNWNPQLTMNEVQHYYRVWAAIRHQLNADAQRYFHATGGIRISGFDPGVLLALEEKGYLEFRHCDSECVAVLTDKDDLWRGLPDYEKEMQIMLTEELAVPTMRLTYSPTIGVRVDQSGVRVA